MGQKTGFLRPISWKNHTSEGKGEKKREGKEKLFILATLIFGTP